MYNNPPPGQQGWGQPPPQRQMYQLPSSPNYPQPQPAPQDNGWGQPPMNQPQAWSPQGPPPQGGLPPSFGLDINAMTNAIRAGDTQVFGENSRNFFDLRKPEGYRASDDSFHADIRIVARPGSGMAHRIIHSKIGRPPETKTNPCPKSLVDPSRRDVTLCSVCEFLAFVGQNPGVANTVVNATVLKDGYPVQKQTTISELVKPMRVSHLLLFTIIEPQYFNNPNAPEKYRGYQMWWCNMRSIITRLKQILGSYPADYFTDPATGRTLHLAFYKQRSGAAMYELTEGPPFAIDPGVAMNAPDPQSFAPSVKNERDIKMALAAMIPGYEP